MTNKVTGYCNALELQGCQGWIMLGVNQCYLVQAHQVISYANPPKSSLSGSKFFTTKAVETMAFFQFPDLRFSFGSVAVKFPYQLIRKLKIGHKRRIEVIGKLIVFFKQRLTTTLGVLGLILSDHNNPACMIPTR